MMETKPQTELEKYSQITGSAVKILLSDLYKKIRYKNKHYINAIDTYELLNEFKKGLRGFG